MIFIFLIASIVLIFLGYHSLSECDWVIEACGIFSTVICVIVLTSLLASFSHSFVVDDKIDMYQDQNTKIEKDISTIVESYKNYEANTFAKCKSNPTLVLSMYPQLESNTLVKEEINVYVKNNNKIRKLKEEKIDYGVTRWWLYFGH